MHTWEYTTRVSPSIISECIIMNEDEKILLDLNNVDKMRNRLREVVPKQIALYKKIKSFNGKNTLLLDTSQQQH